MKRKAGMLVESPGNILADDIFGFEDRSLACDLAMLEDYVKRLTDREQSVIRWRYGYHDGLYHTLREISSSLGLTVSRIQQLNAMALRKLRNPRRRKWLNIDWVLRRIAQEERRWGF